MKNAFVFLSIVTVGLVAGLFYSWAISVMRGLKNVPDREFIIAMQSMNKAILNPLFFLCFFGAVLFLVVSCFKVYEGNYSLGFSLVVSATVLYIVGVMAVTVFVNVPLNNALDSFTVNTASAASIKAMREAFEGKWNFYNNIRTICSVLAFICLTFMVLQDN